MALMIETGRRRVLVQNIAPQIDGGEFAIKRLVGERVTVSADVLTDGHDKLSCVLKYRKADEPLWSEVAMEALGNDRWQAEFRVGEVGRYRYTIESWVDHFKSWQGNLKKRVAAGQPFALDLQVGAELVRDAARRAAGLDSEQLLAWAAKLQEGKPNIDAVELGLSDRLAHWMALYSDRRLSTVYAKELEVIVDRERAGCGAWYEMFPRSCGTSAGKPGILRDCEQRLPYVAAMGFDVLYLPPIHPIGHTHRKGRNGAANAEASDVGSPWAIGSEQGGHKAIHPELGTLDDFDHLLAKAREYGLELALDLAYQCSPDHPYVKEHPEWFRHRPDGSVQYAENPPKKYEDIFPFDFETEAWRELWEELKDAALFWVRRGVRILRVDNPHTKPFPFWRWLIEEIQLEYPDVIFLAEAFTRPKVMYDLAKLGFSQSYTYFTWRNTKEQLVSYFTELTKADLREFFRPNLWTNTPDILTEYLQYGGRPAFMARLVLAATLGANYGIYGPAFELMENRAREPGSEEYLDSEKYEIRPWDVESAHGLKDFIRRINRIRRENPALQRDGNLSFHAIDNEQLLCYSKQSDRGDNRVLVIVNLDPYHTQSGWVDLPLDELGIPPDQPYQVHDLLGGARYLWEGRRNFVQLNPELVPAHILLVRHRVRSEQQFEYFMQLPRTEDATMQNNPLWHKEAIIYQLHIRSFCDANDDGIGDFRGLTSKLDYLQDLGVNALWLLPFYPSPLKDDGYDIADYQGIHPMYGTLHDFRSFLREAHDRGLRVITELVLNHTSDEHPWFRRARNAKPGSRWRDWYVWSDTPDRYKDARIIFRDFETSNWTWDPVAKAYYWHRFYRHQPDLNFDNPEVRQALLQIMDHWFGMGVDGMRLDAVPYLVEREGTNCENLPETHAFLKELRAHVDARFQGRMLLAEANQWPEDAVNYFGNGDECHAAFHFPLMPRLFIALQMEDSFPIVDTLAQTPAIPDVCQWMLFLRNHDELTLEMVTEEERDYMYRIYARDPRARVNLGIRRRLAPLMGNNRRKIELLNALLLSLPGAPIIYYGDELGMGDNIYLGDRNGVRTPMQWNANRNAGFSNAGPQQLYLPVVVDYEYHYETVNVETQQNNPNSLLAWMKRLIALRHGSLALGQGTLEMLHPSNPKILAFIRRAGNERVLVVANLSRFPQYTELDLTSLEGHLPIELFGQVEFPRIGQNPYLLTLGSYAFFWFALCPASPLEITSGSCHLPEAAKESQLAGLQVQGTWDAVFEGPACRKLEGLLPAFLRSRRWFGGKARTIRATNIYDVLPIRSARLKASVGLALLRVEYTDGEPEGYLIPIGFGDEEQLRTAETPGPAAIICRLEVEKGGARSTGVLYDAFGEEGLSRFFLDLTASRRRFHGRKGTLSGRPSKAFRRMRNRAEEPLKIVASKADQSNSTVFYGDQLLLKLFRRLEEGVNPELEIEAFLTDNLAFPHAPPLAGSIEYVTPRHTPVTIGVIEGFVHNEGNAWNYTLEYVESYFERVLAQQPLAEVPADAMPHEPLVQLAAKTPPSLAESMFGPYLQSAGLLGRRTAELHIALASETDLPHFGQEPFSQLYQRSLYQAVRNLAARTFTTLRRNLGHVSNEVQTQGEAVMAREGQFFERLRQITKRKIDVTRIRCHGDYHLGQVLYTGRDFVIVDFEGEPARSISERQLRASPFRDVAGMLRSFDYVCYSALADRISGTVLSPEESARLQGWMRFWTSWSGAAFLQSYLAVAKGQPFVPQNAENTQLLLDVYLFEKSLYELAYELNNRPDWARIALHGMLQLLDEPSLATTA